MTLIIPVGKESLSCVSEDGDDADSGCLAGSPEDTLNKDFVKNHFLDKLEDISSNSADEGNTESIECNQSQEHCCYEYSSEDRSVTTLSLNDSEVAKISSEPILTSGDKITIIENDSDSDIEILNNSNTIICLDSSSNEKADNFQNEGFFKMQLCEDKIASSTLPNLRHENFNCSVIKGDTGHRNVKIIESRMSPEKNLKLVNSSNVINTINFNLFPKESQAVRLRKLLQRRSVSESSSNDLEIKAQNKIRENIRHSFSSYESCDKLRNIFTSDFFPNSKSNLSSEYINNTTNDLLSSDKKLESLRNSVNNNNNSNKITYESRGRVNNFEIPDTLINNVRKSMIAEYQKLKKNSSLAYHKPSDSHLLSTSVESNRFSSNITEIYNNDPKEIVNHDFAEQVECDSGSISDTRENNGNNVADSIYSNSFQVSDMSNTTHSASYPLKATSDRDSSPPSRLELWKSILAEKKNSIKNNLIQNGDIIERLEHKHPEISVDSKSDFNDNDISANNHKIHPSDNNLLVSMPEKSFSIGHLSDNESNIETTGTVTLREKLEHATQDACFNNMIIVEFSGSLPDEDENYKSKRKSKLAEAFQGIVNALDSLPDFESERAILKPKHKSESLCKDTENSSDIVDRDSKVIKDMQSKNLNFVASSIASIITTIPPPECNEISNNEKGQQCPTPLYCSDDETFCKTNNSKGNHSTSSGNESDYCQTDTCGDDCDYCSGDEAEDELDDTCDACRRSTIVSSVCKHMRVMTNGSLRSFKNNQPKFNDLRHHKMTSRSLNLQAVLRRSHINHQELSAIREYSVTSDEHQDSDDDLSHDGSICDISSSWRYGLCEDQRQNSYEMKHEKNRGVSNVNSKVFAKIKSNSLPASKTYSRTTPPKRPESAVLKQNFYSDDDSPAFITHSGGVHLPPRPPRLKKNQHPTLSISPPSNPTSFTSPQVISPRPMMGLHGLQQKPSYNKHTLCIQTGPKTLAPRSPLNPNPPYGFPNPPSPPIGSPGSPFQGRKSPLEAPPSPRTNSRSGALVTRNFSISDDEGGQRLSRRQVTITRHEGAYKEAAEKGYLLPPSSPIDPYWLTWKLGVLIKTVEEVGSRLEESEKIVSTWGPLPQDQNLADQYVHNVRKFRETLPDLQRGVDDVNDQAARFSAHNVPLTPANSAALHDINSRWKNLETTVNDRWRQIAGRSREVTPLTPAQLASSVSPPWERATATNKVPYYINHAQETTHWDHPQMMDLLDSLSEFNHIKFSAYRTATKLRSLQKKLSLDRAKLQMVTDVFDEHGLRGQNDRLIDVNDMIVVLSTLYGRISSDHNDVNTTLATDLCLNWLLNVYDSQRTGQMRVLSFRVGLICLCRGHLEEKYRYMFRLIADPNRLVDQRKLGLLLHDCVQVPRQLGEVAAFGGSNIEPSVRSCFTKAGKDRETIEAVHFLTWVQQEPQSLVWLAVLHRVAASENVQHQVKCNICKTYPIVGLRYRCLKCLSFDMCQRCFFEGRSSKSHKITHPMHEYCTATTAGDEMKDFTKALKNKFKSKRSLQKHTKKGYLPVQTVLEGDPLESPSPSPSHNVSSQDMHSRLELYASRLAEVELRTNSNSTPDSEDEHGLIAQYCQSLSSTDAPFPVPKSPLQIMASVDADQKDELEQMIKDLEEENRALQAEYERLKSEQPTGSISEDGMGQRSEAEMLAEAKLLREHKERLEARMSILEDHNRQLEAQLQRLRQLLVEQQTGMGSPNKSSTLQTKSVTASQLAMDSPGKINGHAIQGGPGSAYEGLDQMSEYVRPPPPPVGSIAHMGNLYARAGDPEKPVGSPITSMSREKENGSHSDDEEDQSDENDYDNTVSPVPPKTE